MNREVRKIRRISYQKIFNFVSFSFILACCIFYGTRFIKLYREHNKENEVETLATNILNSNNGNDKFKKIGDDYYFTEDNENNYIKYSNLMWRIIKVNKDKSITIVLDNSITALAAGSSNSFENADINNWLNNKNNENDTGILQNNLNNVSTYLAYTKTCSDTIKDYKKITCDKTTEGSYITTPSIYDYINTGGENSFMNNEENFYLINYDSDNKIVYVNDKGKIKTSDKNDIIGIKPVITIKSTVTKVDGDGNKDNPYTIETNSSLFGGYVKLGSDTWRIYNVSEDNAYLSLDSYLKVNGEEITLNYSNNNYYHNDTIYGSLAYYLNTTYINNLSYKDIIKEENFPNGIYNNTNFDYREVLNKTVPTKVSPLSIGNIILNPKLTNYYLSTGISENSNLIYTMTNDFNLYTKNGTNSLKIVPTIQIKKDLLTKGDGSLESPYEVE